MTIKRKEKKIISKTVKAVATAKIKINLWTEINQTEKQ